MTYNPEHYLSWVEPWPDGNKNTGTAYVEMTIAKFLETYKETIDEGVRTPDDRIDKFIVVNWASVNSRSIADRLKDKG